MRLSLTCVQGGSRGPIEMRIVEYLPGISVSAHYSSNTPSGAPLADEAAAGEGVGGGGARGGIPAPPLSDVAGAGSLALASGD